MRWTWLFLAGLALLPACFPQYLYTPAPQLRVQATTRQRCWREPTYAIRVTPRTGERVERVCETCNEWMLCEVQFDGRELCSARTDAQWNEWRRSRARRVQVGEQRVCAAEEAAPVQPTGGYVAPAYVGGGGGGPVHVRGYYRRDGTYVRPHTRSRPRRR